MLFVNSAEKYLRRVAGSGATILFEHWFQLGEGSSADVRTDAVVVLNQNLLLLTWCTICGSLSSARKQSTLLSTLCSVYPHLYFQLSWTQ